MSQHTPTPGPWTLSKRRDGATFIMAKTGWIAEMRMLDLPQEANARLIAAAPEMWKLIHRVAFEPVGASDASHATVLEMLTGEARALLARIEGE